MTKFLILVLVAFSALGNHTNSTAFGRVIAPCQQNEIQNSDENIPTTATTATYVPSTQSYDYVEQTRPRPRPRIGEYVPITTTGYPPRPIDNEEALNYNHNRKMVFNHPDRRYEIQTNSIEQGTEMPETRYPTKPYQSRNMMPRYVDIMDKVYKAIRYYFRDLAKTFAHLALNLNAMDPVFDAKPSKLAVAY